MSDAAHSSPLPDFNPQRLSVARRRRGMTKVKLAEVIGVSARIVTEYERERGTKRPGALTLSRIADRLNFPIEFFAGDNLDEPAEAGTSFRALTNLTAKEREQAITAGALAYALSDWIDQRFVLPDSNIPRYQGVDPETAAVALRNEWGLGERPIKHMLRTLEANGARVFSLAEECESVDAFSVWRGRRPFVFLNTRKSAEHSRMDAAHELGHLVLHWKDKAHGRKAEQEAAQFASAFLMPQASVRASAPRGGTLPEIISAKKRWGVSVAALTYRMHSVGMLSEWQYRTLFVQLSAKGYRKREPEGMQAETSLVLAKVFTKLREDGVSKADVARALALPPDELASLVFGLVLTPIGLPGAGERSEASPKPQLRVV